MQTIPNISLKSDISICRLIERFRLKSDVKPSVYFPKPRTGNAKQQNRKPHFSTNDKQNRKWHTHKRQREKPEIMKPAADSTKATKNILLLHKHTKNDIKRKQITKYY